MKLHHIILTSLVCFGMGMAQASHNHSDTWENESASDIGGGAPCAIQTLKVPPRIIQSYPHGSSELRGLSDSSPVLVFDGQERLADAPSIVERGTRATTGLRRQPGTLDLTTAASAEADPFRPRTPADTNFTESSEDGEYSASFGEPRIPPVAVIDTRGEGHVPRLDLTALLSSSDYDL